MRRLKQNGAAAEAPEVVRLTDKEAARLRELERRAQLALVEVGRLEIERRRADARAAAAGQRALEAVAERDGHVRDCSLAHGIESMPAHYEMKTDAEDLAFRRRP